MVIRNGNISKTDKSNRILDNIKFNMVFQIYTPTINGKEYNNFSLIDIENWHYYKHIFFYQRVLKNKLNLSIREKTLLELYEIKQLNTTSIDNRLLKNRYVNYLENKLSKSCIRINLKDY